MNGSNVYYSGRDNAYMANAWRGVACLVSNYTSSLICVCCDRARAREVATRLDDLLR